MGKFSCLTDFCCEHKVNHSQSIILFGLHMAKWSVSTSSIFNTTHTPRRHIQAVTTTGIPVLPLLTNLINGHVTVFQDMCFSRPPASLVPTNMVVVPQELGNMDHDGLQVIDFNANQRWRDCLMKLFMPSTNIKLLSISLVFWLLVGHRFELLMWLQVSQFV